MLVKIYEYYSVAYSIIRGYIKVFSPSQVWISRWYVYIRDSLDNLYISYSSNVKSGVRMWISRSICKIINIIKPMVKRVLFFNISNTESRYEAFKLINRKILFFVF